MLVETIHFDCDNTLVLSEDEAFKACASVVNGVLAAKGVSRTFTGPLLMKQCVGQTFRKIVLGLGVEHGFTIGDDELNDLATQEEDAVIARLADCVRPCHNVNAVLADLVGRYEMTVVSSSALRRVRACLKKADQERFFRSDYVFSATSSLPAPRSKPDPAIVDHTLQFTGASAETSVAVEDSRSGVLCWRQRNITVIGYVGAYPLCQQKQAKRMLLDNGAAIVMHDWKEFPGVLSQLQHCN